MSKRQLMLINPEIVSKGDTPRVHEEGCLSIPEMYAEVQRPAWCACATWTSRARSRRRISRICSATVVQHEIDHLDGHLFIDHLSRLKRDLLVKKFYKLQKEKATAL